MSRWRRASKTLIHSLNLALKKLGQDDVSEFCDFLLGTKKRGGTLYLIGRGRSLDVLMIFGARVMQAPISLESRPLLLLPKPHIENGDSALICTGTGETGPVLSLVESWLKINSNIGLITSIAARKYHSKILDLVKQPRSLIFLPGITKRDIERRRKKPFEIHSPLPAIYPRKNVLIPSPTKFELGALILLESIVTELKFSCEETLNGDTMR